MKPILAHPLALLWMATLSACTIGTVSLFQNPTAPPTPPIPTLIPTIPPTPTPTPPFRGRLLLRISTTRGTDIYELSYDAKTWTTTSTPIVEGAGRAILSPDGSHLVVYLDEARKTAVMDLLTGEETTFDVPEDLGYMTSASVSPDSTGICYTTDTGKIYLQNIPLGKSWLVYKPQSSYYLMSGRKVYVHGETSCGPWIGNERFVINRYVGSMPSKVTFPGYHEVNVNKTTVVTTGGRPKLEDTRQLLSVEAVSADGLSVVYIDKNDGSAYIARDFSSFRKMESQLLVPLSAKQSAFFEFLPDDRLLCTVCEYSYGDLRNTKYSIVNPDTIEFREFELPGECGYGYGLLRGGGWDGGAYHRRWQWIEGSGSDIIACTYATDLVFVGDIATDSATEILELETDIFTTGAEIIGWLP